MTPAKAAGLDLLDRLLRSQVFVHLAMTDEEHDWLYDICSAVRAKVRKSGVEGLFAERVCHWVYCFLEIYLADRWGEGLETLPGRWQIPPDLSIEDFAKVDENTRQFFAAYALALDDVVTEAVSPIAGQPSAARVALDMVDGLLPAYRKAPAVVRLRLAERALALEYPGVAIETLQWLASIGAVPTKYSAARQRMPINQGVALRAASIFEFETLREYMLSVVRREVPNDAEQPWVRESPGGRQLRRDFTELWQRRDLRDESSVRHVGAFPRCLEDTQARAFLAGCWRLTPYLRVAVKEQQNALADIAAVRVTIEKARYAPRRSLYSEEAPEGTLSQETSALLQALGFQLHPRTIHRHVKSRVAPLVHVQTRVREAILHIGSAWPAYWPDVVYPVEVAHARGTAAEVPLDFVRGGSPGFTAHYRSSEPESAA